LIGQLPPPDSLSPTAIGYEAGRRKLIAYFQGYFHYFPFQDIIIPHKVTSDYWDLEGLY
jgi:hypothetical protein